MLSAPAVLERRTSEETFTHRGNDFLNQVCQVVFYRLLVDKALGSRINHVYEWSTTYPTMYSSSKLLP